LHFVLRPDVVDFVEALPKRLRNVKTQTRDVTETARGGIDGRIDWPSTIRERYATNPNDAGLFVCDKRNEDYDVDENVVLKRLLAIVYRTLDDLERFLKRDYDWVTERWHENGDLVNAMKRIFERNVHVMRIREPESYEPTERMLQHAERSRNEVYRDAAALLRTYRQSVRADEDAIRELLEQTTITPDDDETLFELYVLFRHVAVVEDLQDDQFTIQTIDTSSQAVAQLETDDASIVLYHDSSATEHDLSFKTEPLDSRPADDLSRMESVQREAREVARTYFRERAFQSVTGRPDVIVLEVQTDGRREYLVTEVKNSRRVETIQRGIRETLEYLAFLRREDDFVHEDGFFGSGWNGVLVVQNLDDEDTAPLDEQRSIKILQAGEVEEKLRRVVGELLA
jgi:8-oxo-dGTP pyrophosphatase MutT (NUDIX family)